MKAIRGPRSEHGGPGGSRRNMCQHAPLCHSLRAPFFAFRHLSPRPQSCLWFWWGFKFCDRGLVEEERRRAGPVSIHLLVAKSRFLQRQGSGRFSSTSFGLHLLCPSRTSPRVVQVSSAWPGQDSLGSAGCCSKCSSKTAALLKIFCLNVLLRVAGTAWNHGHAAPR